MRSSETYEQSYPGNASTVTAYEIQFQFLDSADLEIMVTDQQGAQELLTETTDYVITRDTVTQLGSFVTTAAIPATSTIKVYRANQLTQGHDYVNADTFPADTHEAAMDRQTEGLQSVKGMAARALRVSPADSEIEPTTVVDNSVAGIGASGEFLFRTAEELVSFLSLTEPVINQPTKTWANNAERALAVPDFLGQIGTQRDTGALYASTGTSAGNWGTTTASTVADLSITREKLADGLLTADMIGRAKMADSFVTLAKMNVDFITSMTAKTLLDDGDYLAGYSASDAAFRKFAGNVAVPAGCVIQTISATPYTANANLAAIPIDDTIPQITEGTQVCTLSISPMFADSKIRLVFNGFASGSVQSSIVASVFRNSVTNALKTTSILIAAGLRGELNIDWIDSPATTSATTYSVRVGGTSGAVIRMNGTSVSRLFGGNAAATLIAQEIKV